MNLDKLNELAAVEEEAEETEVESDDSEYALLDDEGLMLAKAAGLDPKKAEAMAAFIQHCMNSSSYED